MTHSTNRPTKGFTLIELLTVIAIIGILASIIIPTVGKVRETARRTVDASNLRQIAQASLIYATDNNDLLPGLKIETSTTNFGSTTTGTTGADITPYYYAAALAVSGGINDASIWVSAADRASGAATANANLGTILNSDKNAFATSPNFQTLILAYGVVGGLSASQPATIPVAFTRGILAGANGKWSQSVGVYADDGGYIAFLGGNVSSFMKNLGTGTTDGALIGSNGSPTNIITATIRAGTNAPKFAEGTGAAGGNKEVAASGT